mgnify:CR=1 FL=1
MTSKTTFLLFDNRIDYGSPEHFFHFMWGYLLPAISIIQKKDRAQSYIMTSCGPLMDVLTNDIMKYLTYSVEIIKDDAIHDVEIQIITPRWDISALQPLILDEKNVNYPDIVKMRQQLLTYPDLLDKLKAVTFINDLSIEIHQVKALVEQAISVFPPHEDLAPYDNAFLILSRSSQPKFYSKWWGKAKIPGYGSARRALSNVKKTKKELIKKHISVEIFEPGSMSLKEQIQTFSSCKGIVAIKGAEFASLIWFKPQSLIVLIKPKAMNTAPVQKYLANIFDLKYIEIEINQGNFPELSSETLIPYMEEI